MSTKSWADQEAEHDDVAKVEEKLEKTEIAKEEKQEKEEKESKEEPTIVRFGGLSRGGKIIIEQADPNSPLYSIKSFDELGLKPELLKGVYAMNYNKPSKIQEAALPVILEPSAKNLIGQAQSGTGKTAAFTLCVLSRSNVAVKAPQAMIICPTRELARQIQSVVDNIGKYSGLTTQLVVKDEKFPRKIEAQIIVGTPGKIEDCLKKRIIVSNNIKVLVLDEADVMMDIAGMQDSSIRIKNMLPKTCQILLFSATFKPEVRAFAERAVPQPCVNIHLKKKELTLDAITQLYIDCKTEDNKFNVLSDIYGFLTIGQSMIFVHTRKTAIELTKKMIDAGHTVSLLHGGDDMTSAERDKVIDDFRDGKTRVLISTNVLARGIDILQVMLVINYDLPLDHQNQIDPQTYLHRIGRSGRFGRKGIAINFVADHKSKGDLKFLEEFCQRPIKNFPADKIEDLQGMLEEVNAHDRKLDAMRAAGEVPDEEED